MITLKTAFILEKYHKKVQKSIKKHATWNR